MRHRSGPLCLLLLCLVFSALAPGQAPDSAPEPAPPPRDIDLPPGSLQQALDRLTQQTGLQLLYDPAVVQGRFAQEVQGSMSATQALARLLAPTDVSFQLTGPNAAALIAAPDSLEEVRITADEPRFAAPTRRDRIGRIWAPVKINGKGPFRLVLDTGASHSALIARTARQLGVLPDTHPERLYGVTGTALVPSVHVDTMEVGSIQIDATNLPVVADVFAGADGVLGRQGLQNQRIMADFSKDRLVITRSHGEDPPSGYKVVHLKLTNMGLLAAEAGVGNVTATVIIDTGSQATIGNLALRNALMRARPTGVAPTDVVGVTLDKQQCDEILSPVISLGQLRVNGARIAYGDMSLFEHWQLTSKPTLLVGMDVLGLVDVLIIDYKLRQLQVRTRG